jgi:hypothetical protein
MGVSGRGMPGLALPPVVRENGHDGARRVALDHLRRWKHCWPVQCMMMTGLLQKARCHVFAYHKMTMGCCIVEMVDNACIYTYNSPADSARSTRIMQP